MEDYSEKINALAERLRGLVKGSTRYEALEINLVQLLQKQKGYADLDKTEVVYSQKKYNYYDPLIFAEVYMDTIRDFFDDEKGLDEQGKKKSFMHLFNTYYKVKEPEIKTAQNEESSYGGLKDKRKYIRNIVNAILKKHKAKTVYTDYNVLNEEKVEILLLKAGASQEEIDSYHAEMKLTVGSILAKDDENDDSIENYAVDKEVYLDEEVRQQAKQEAFEKVVKVAFEALALYKGKKMEQQLKLYLTLLISKEVGELSEDFLKAMGEALEQEFMRFYLKAVAAGEKSDIAIWAAFTGLQHDSARKQLKKLENILKELA